MTSTTTLNNYLNWPGVAQVFQVERKRTVGEKTSVELSYYITSLSRERANAAKLLELTRGHWGAIENGLHWVRDEVLGEDRSPTYCGQAPQNLAALRNTALNWIRRQGIDTFASTLRSFARNPLRLFTKLGYRN